ncbi:MAG: hypothetical protein SFW07_08235 [Gammaproteobacteria bacterium]|nr:hypothetical protein [Gammaproteobacteria bacterium]
MKTLDEILARKAEIKSRAQDFGYSDAVRIACEQSQPKAPVALGLIVGKTPGASVSYKRRGWLIEVLSKEPGCQVNVTVLDNVENTYKYDAEAKSTSIDDDDAICKLFGVASPREISLQNAGAPNKSRLNHAEEYLRSLSDNRKTPSDAEKFSRLAFLPPPAKETPQKKLKPGSSEESSASPPEGSTESPLKKPK